jgi:hypothetical protein
MSRTEENKEILKTISGAFEKEVGTYEKMIVFQLSYIAAILADISKSLAIIADKAESEDKECSKL